MYRMLTRHAVKRNRPMITDGIVNRRSILRFIGNARFGRLIGSGKSGPAIRKEIGYAGVAPYDMECLAEYYTTAARPRSESFTARFLARGSPYRIPTADSNEKRGMQSARPFQGNPCLTEERMHLHNRQSWP